MDSDQIYIEQFFVIIDHFLSCKCPLYHGFEINWIRVDSIVV